MVKDTGVIFGDIHSYVYHRDTVAFCKAVKEQYRPNWIVLTGDEVNWESIAYHEHNPDLPGALEELDKSIDGLQPFYKMFPKADILWSNHGDLPYRKGRTAGLPSRILRSRNEILMAPKGWRWYKELVVKTRVNSIYFTHGKTKTIGRLSKSMAMCAVQGHYHSRFYISYWASPVGLYWDANAGSFLDQKHLAAEYASNDVEKGIMGCIVVESGVPHLVPMVLNKNSRWIGNVK